MSNFNTMLTIKIIVAFTLAMLYVILFSSKDDIKATEIIFALMTFVPLFISIFLRRRLSPRFETIINNILICSVWFIIGFFIFKITNDEDTMRKIPYPVFFISLAIYALMFIFSGAILLVKLLEDAEVSAQLKQDKTSKKLKEIENITKMVISSSSGIRDFNSLFEKIISEKPNIVIIAGNLLSMSTNEGANLVNNYLNQGEKNVMKLLIPESSQSFLSAVKTQIKESSLNRLEIFVADPFWFLQGIAILGKRKVDDNSRIEPFGCIFYKIKLSKDDENSKEGIYIDLRTTDAVEIKDSFAAYYSLLNSLEYSEGAYKVKKIFTKRNPETKKDEIFHVKKQIKWDTI